LSAVLCALPLRASALTDFAVVVHSDNAASDVSKSKLVRIFKAEVQEWAPGAPIVLTLPKAGSDEKDALLERVYEMEEGELKRYWTKLVYQNRITEQPRAAPSAAVALQIVARTKAAVAIVPVEALAGVTGVKVLAIDGKKPGERDYLLHVADKPKSEGADDASARETPPATRDAAAEQDPVRDAQLADLAQRLERLEGERDAELEAADEPDLDLRGFGHVEAGLEDVDPDGAGHSTDDAFALGGLDLFLTARLSDRLSFLNETVFEPTEEGEYVLDVERVVLKYRFGDWLNVQAGRFHTTLGWWNENFHHGEWLQTSVGRPAVLAFEDEDGILPVHLVGLVLKGRNDCELGALEYTLEVGNGRGPAQDPPQIVVDANDSKAINLALSFAPSAIHGLTVGAASYTDNVPTNDDPALGPLHGAFDEQISVAFARWESERVELVGELFLIDHFGSNSASSSGWYAQAGWRAGAWTPYARVDAVEIADSEEYFASTDDLTTFALGCRWDFEDWAALKLQASRTDVDAGPGGTDETRHALVLQGSFSI
jgi:hypothetical protein